MSAVMAAVHEKPDRYLMAGMRALLRKWGAICEHARNWNGYPSMDTTYRARLGGGFGQRLPICEVPAFAVQMSNEVMRLPDEEGNAVTIWYAHNFNASGAWLRVEDKALLLRVSVDTLRDRERAGRIRLIARGPRIMEQWQSWQDSQFSDTNGAV